MPTLKFQSVKDCYACPSKSLTIKENIHIITVTCVVCECARVSEGMHVCTRACITNTLPNPPSTSLLL